MGRGSVKLLVLVAISALVGVAIWLLWRSQKKDTPGPPAKAVQEPPTAPANAVQVPPTAPANAVQVPPTAPVPQPYNSTLPTVHGGQVLAHWDSMFSQSIVGPTGAVTVGVGSAVAEWRPAEGTPSLVLTSKGPSSAQLGMVGSMPGIHFPLNSCLVVGGGITSPADRTPSVFVVATMHGTTEQMRLLLTLCPNEPNAGCFGLFQDVSPECPAGAMTWRLTRGSDANSDFIDGKFTGNCMPSDVPLVWGLQVFNSRYLTVRQLPGGGLSGPEKMAEYKFSQDAPIPAANAALCLGAYFDPDRRAVIGSARCTVHELVVYDALLTYTEATTVYTHLRAKWGVRIPELLPALSIDPLSTPPGPTEPVIARAPPYPRPTSPRYLSSLPVVGNLVVHWDASHVASRMAQDGSLSTSEGSTVALWWPVAASAGNIDIWPLIATTLGVQFKAPAGRPGIFMPAGAMMGTVNRVTSQAGQTPFVFVVATVHAPTVSGVRHFVGMRPADATAGSFTLAIDTSTSCPQGVMRSSLYNGSMWITTLMNCAQVDTVMVWGFQAMQMGTDILYRQLPSQLPARGTEFLPLENTIGPGQITRLDSELTIGGIRDIRGLSVPGREHGQCTIHEVVVFDGNLSSDAARMVYRHLRKKWDVAIPQLVN